jgi:type II secretory pathway component GspD/PulD (secretin)
MVKRGLLFLGLIGSLALASSATLPNSGKFTAPVTIQVGQGPVPLAAVLQALGRSVGLTVVTEQIPKVSVDYQIQGKPFLEVWKLLLRLNGLSYRLYAHGIVVVGPTSVIAALAPAKPKSAVRIQSPPATEQRFYTLVDRVSTVEKLLSEAIPGLKIHQIGASQVIAVVGTAAQQAQVRALLPSLDQAPKAQAASGPTIVQAIFHLANASAVQVKAELQGTLQTNLTATNFNTGTVQTAPGAVSAATVTAPTRTPSASTTTSKVPAPDIIADPRTNTLIVRGTPSQVAQIAKLIPVLDAPVPEINVQVRIEEITQTAAQSLGLNWSAGIGNFVTKLLSGNLSVLFDATQNLTGFNVGATLTALEQQGLSKQVDDTTLTLASGQTTPAFINSGGNLTLTLPGTPPTTLTLPYGVIVQITNPQVNSNGTISMQIDASVKDTPIVNNGTINIPNREANTSLLLKSGQTALLGGLLATTVTKSTNGIPVLSNIPIIGALFRTTQTSTDRSQLLLVVSANTVSLQKAAIQP